MSYDQTSKIGPDQAPRRPPEEASTGVMRGGGQSDFPLPPTMAPQSREGYAPAPMPAAKTEVMRKAPTTLAWLAAVNGPRPGRLYQLSAAGTTIGRDSHNDVVVDENYVSLQHAKVRLEKNPDGREQFYVYDLATTNGTFVNGQQIVKEPLFDNDRIAVGTAVFVFKQIDGPERAVEAPPAPAPEEGG